MHWFNQHESHPAAAAPPFAVGDQAAFVGTIADIKLAECGCYVVKLNHQPGVSILALSTWVRKVSVLSLAASRN